MKLTQRIVAVLLAVCLCAGLNSAAFAAAEPSCTQSPCTHAAAIGQTHFDTVQEAIDAAASGETVTLLRDTAENVTVAADDTLTLDLDGWCLQNADGHTITNYGTLVLTGDGVVDNVTHARGALYNAGTTAIENCTLTRSAEAGSAPDNSGGNSWYVVFNAASGTLRLESGARVLGTSGFSSCLRNDGELTICGGSIEQLQKDGYDLSGRYNDCGVMIFDTERQDVHAGGSGCGCSASVLCGYLLSQMRKGALKRLLFCATGALLSPVSSWQGESIPGICHAISIVTERR